MDNSRQDWTDSLIAAAKTAGLWDESATDTHRAELICERLGYSSRHVQRWIDQEVKPPNGRKRDRLLALLVPASRHSLTPQSVDATPQMSDIRQLPIFASEKERRAATLTVLYFAQKLGPQLVQAVDEAVTTLLGTIVAEQADLAERGGRNAREGSAVPTGRRAKP